MKTSYPPNTKRTDRLQPSKKLEFLQGLMNFMGYPLYYEELLIYIKPEGFPSIPHFRIALTKEGLRWNWFDTRFSKDNNPYSRTTNSIRTGVNDIKEKLTFTATAFGNKGTITTARVHKFTHSETGLIVEYRPDTLIGPIASTIKPIKHLNDIALLEQNNILIRELIEKLVTPYIYDDLLNATNNLVNDNEEYLTFTATGNILHPTILSFCQRNGIVNPFKSRKTYKELLEIRHNDYSIYEELFKDLTKVPLLTKDRHFNIPDNFEIPKTSIIIPCFNTEKTIKRTLRSIVSQKLPNRIKNNLEVILVDDGSNNPIADFIEKETYPFKIRILRLDVNDGVSNARLLGVTQSTGEILIFLDSDLILSDHYIADHIIRNVIIENAVFVSFKENVESDDARINLEEIEKGASLPKYEKDLRIFKSVTPNSIGAHKAEKEQDVRILEETNHFKNFHGAQKFGVYDLSCMVTGHNFSIKKDLIYQSSPFDKMFKGWGMEDNYFGLKMITNGNYIIPVMSSGVFHINHEVRSGSEDKKQAEYLNNIAVIKGFLDSIVE